MLKIKLFIGKHQKKHKVKNIRQETRVYKRALPLIQKYFISNCLCQQRALLRLMTTKSQKECKLDLTIIYFDLVANSSVENMRNVII